MFTGLLAAYGIPIGIALFVVYVALTSPEKIEYFWGWIGGKLSRAESRLSRHSLGQRLDSHLNDFAASAMANLEHIEPTGVKTSWLENEGDVRAALSSDGDVVIFLNPSLPDG
ncbi:MAG: hypothetical protein IBX63_11620 [Coriobacteriia bacterium]|nr:hypothetical protein [Coriobacteriia bacterium]